MLVPPDSPRPMADRMISILADEELRRTMRERGLARVASYSAERTAAQIVTCYENIINSSLKR